MLIKADTLTLQGELRGVVVARRWYPAGAEMPPHSHGDGAVSFVIAGSVVEWSPAQGGRCDACAGASVVKPARVVHSNRFGPRGAHLVSVEVAEAAAGSACDVAAALARELLAAPHLYGWSAHHLHALVGLRLMAAMAQPPESAGHAVAAVLADLLRRLRRAGQAPARRAASGAPWMPVAMKRLHAPDANGLRVHALAHDLKVHPVSLARGFRREHGCAVSAYRQRLRLVRAAGRLAQTSQPPCRIALECGFADQAHLCRAFRRDIGLSPGQFRALLWPPQN